MLNLLWVTNRIRISDTFIFTYFGFLDFGAAFGFPVLKYKQQNNIDKLYKNSIRDARTPQSWGNIFQHHEI